jgi:hypothetical protein
MTNENAGVANLHIFINRDALVLVRTADAAVREFQDQYPDFMTSLGPFDRDGVLDTFENEWPDLLVTHHDAIRTFTNGDGVPPATQLRIEITKIP